MAGVRPSTACAFFTSVSDEAATANPHAQARAAQEAAPVHRGQRLRQAALQAVDERGIGPPR